MLEEPETDKSQRKELEFMQFLEIKLNLTTTKIIAFIDCVNLRVDFRKYYTDTRTVKSTYRKSKKEEGHGGRGRAYSCTQSSRWLVSPSRRLPACWTGPNL